MWPCPIRLQDYLVIIISARNQSIMLSFLHKDSHQGKKTFENTAFSRTYSDIPSHNQTSQEFPGCFWIILWVQPDQN